MAFDKDVITNIVRELHLTEEDRKLIQAKRGFNDDIIEKLEFKSIGPEISNFCRENIFINKASEDVVNVLTQQKNILIPYYNENLEIFKFRPHKSYIKNDVPDLYCPWPIINPNNENVWILTEGEFKAAAAVQLGFNAVAAPGISIFTRRHAEKLLDFFRKIKPKGIILCFDNEIKDNPHYPNYKADYTKRYDSQFYSYINAKILEKEFPSVMICTLPLEYNIEGKTDIDGMLSLGFSSLQFSSILVSQSLTANEYKRSWKKYPPNHLSFLERRVDKWFYRGPIKEEFNRYFIKKGTSKEMEDGTRENSQEISNFCFQIIHTIKGDTGSSGEVQRLVRLKSNYGTSDPFILTSDMMASKGALIKTIMSKGDYTFMGPENILQELWRYLFMAQSGQIIRSINLYGYDKYNDMWIFSNGIYQNNEFHQVDENGIVQIKDEFFKIMESQAELEKNDLPSPKLEQTIPDYSIQDLFNNFYYISDEHFARMFLGWAFGIFFCDLIIQKYKNYPFIYLDGPYGSGKSSLAELLMAFFGMQSSKGIPLQGSTKVGMRNMSTRYSMLPVHFEESRQGDDGTVATNSFFRSFYDRSTMIKGSKKDGEIITKTAMANCIVSGEEAPVDAATSSRFIILSVSKHTHKRAQNKEAFDWLQKNKATFSYWSHCILTQKASLWEKIEQYIDEYIEGFKDKPDLSSRNKIHNCIIAGVADAILGESEEFTKLVFLKAKTAEGKVKAIQAIDVFWNDISALSKEYIIKEKYFVLEEEHGKVILKVSFHSLYTIWEKHYKNLRKNLPISREALLTHMRTEPYFYDVRRFRLREERPLGVILKFCEELPDGLIDYVVYEEKKNGTVMTSLAQELIDKFSRDIDNHKPKEN